MDSQPFQNQPDILVMLKRHIKVASIFSIDITVLKAVKKGQHMDQQSGQHL